MRKDRTETSYSITGFRFTTLLRWMLLIFLVPQFIPLSACHKIATYPKLHIQEIKGAMVSQIAHPASDQQPIGEDNPSGKFLRSTPTVDIKTIFYISNAGQPVIIVLLLVSLILSAIFLGTTILFTIMRQK